MFKVYCQIIIAFLCEKFGYFLGSTLWVVVVKVDFVSFGSIYSYVDCTTICIGCADDGGLNIDTTEHAFRPAAEINRPVRDSCIFVVIRCTVVFCRKIDCASRKSIEIFVENGFCFISLGNVGINIVNDISVGADDCVPVGCILPPLNIGEFFEYGFGKGTCISEYINHIWFQRSFRVVGAFYRVKIIGIVFESGYGSWRFCDSFVFDKIIPCFYDTAISITYFVNSRGTV